MDNLRLCDWNTHTYITKKIRQWSLISHIKLLTGHEREINWYKNTMRWSLSKAQYM